MITSHINQPYTIVSSQVKISEHNEESKVSLVCSSDIFSSSCKAGNGRKVTNKMFATLQNMQNSCNYSELNKLKSLKVTQVKD